MKSKLTRCLILSLACSIFSLGVQTVLWGMQWVKAGAALRQWGIPLPQSQRVQRNSADPIPGGFNI